MADIDPELRDKIIETHTLVKRMDKEHDEHKSMMNGRLKNITITLNDHKEEVKSIFKEHDKRIDKAEHFHTRVITYAGVAVVAGGVLLKGMWLGIEKLFTGGGL